MLRPLLYLALMLFSINLFGQDTIVKIDGDRVVAKVKTVDVEEITYTRYGNPDGPEYTLSVEEIWKIIYSDGTIETFTKPPAPRKSPNIPTPDMPPICWGLH